jgi:MscS family membrane protein
MDEGPEEVASDSPRASVQAYLELSRAGRFDEAARYLIVPPELEGQRAQLAERLKAVLDRHLWIDLDALSSDPDGASDDDLPAHVEQIGTIPSGQRNEPVRLVKTRDDQGAYWAFSRATVGRIDRWYDELSDRWLRETLPEPLLRPGPRDVLWWQWLALPLLLLLAWLAGRLLGAVTRRVLGRVFARTRVTWDDRLLDRSAAPLTFGWMLIVASALLPSLDLYAPAEAFLRSVLGAAGVVVVFWILWRAVDVFADALRTTPWAEQSASARSLLAVGGNLLKGFVAAAGVVAMLTELGYPVATLLAGLGIGGIAFAFGAQKTVENLFGSIALAADRPLRVGDFVKVEDFVGTVEDIGLRSTRFRTLDRTVISIPNGKVADMRLESFTARDRMRLATTIGVEYGTSHAQMQQVLEGFERVLREHPKIWPDAMVVKFKEFGASSLDIEIMAWFEVPTWGDFQQCRQEVLLGFMQVVEDAGTAFAFPTRTVHLVDASKAAAAGGE